MGVEREADRGSPGVSSADTLPTTEMTHDPSSTSHRSLPAPIRAVFVLGLLYLFLAGVLGWLIVGVLWNDRAIMLIHFVALGSMLVGMASQ